MVYIFSKMRNNTTMQYLINQPSLGLNLTSLGGGSQKSKALSPTKDRTSSAFIISQTRGQQTNPNHEERHSRASRIVHGKSHRHPRRCLQTLLDGPKDVSLPRRTASWWSTLWQQRIPRLGPARCERKSMGSDVLQEVQPLELPF